MTTASYYSRFAKATARYTGRPEEETLHAFRAKYQALAQAARAELVKGSLDTGTPEP